MSPHPSGLNPKTDNSLVCNNMHDYAHNSWCLELRIQLNELRAWGVVSKCGSNPISIYCNYLVMHGFKMLPFLSSKMRSGYWRGSPETMSDVEPSQEHWVLNYPCVTRPQGWAWMTRPHYQPKPSGKLMNVSTFEHTAARTPAHEYLHRRTCKVAHHTKRHLVLFQKHFRTRLGLFLYCVFKCIAM